MAIPIKINNNFSHVANLERAGSNSLKENNSSTFSDLLRNSLQTVPSENALPTLTKDQLTLLVRSIQIQMNHHLYKMVLSNEAEINYLPSGMLPLGNNNITNMTHSFTDMSKNRQIPPKNIINEVDSKFDSIIEKAAGKYGVDPDLIRSVIKTESNFISDATSPKGAMGLMQLMPGTARDLGVKNAYDPEENVMGGTKYLKSLLNRYDGNVNLALAAYNWGMGNLEKNSHGLPRETSNYIARVNNHYKNFGASA